MDEFFLDDALTNALPPEKVRFVDARVEPWPDGRRVRVLLNLTPFKQRPSLEAVILNAAGDEVASASIIETMTPRLVFTMHIRQPEIPGQYILNAHLHYPDLEKVDQVSVSFTLEAPDDQVPQ